MGDKKKKKPGVDEDDESTANLKKFYRRRCEANSVGTNKLFTEKLDQAADEGDNMTKVSE
jgi:hypothetical protein